MMSPEERLARITGRPVSQTSPPVESPPLSDSFDMPPSSSADSLSVATSTSVADDPPLAGLMGARSQDRGRTESQRGHNLDIVWVLLAVAVRLVLDTEYSGLIGDNILLPFTLSLASLYMLGYVAPTGSTVSSLLSAALMLCGVQARLVGHLTRTLSLGQMFIHTFSL